MKNRKHILGFSLVELLAVVLILAVLAAIAIPLYINTRKTSAARTCKANIAAIAAAESAFALRNGVYSVTPFGNYVTSGTPPVVTATSGLVGAPEGLSAAMVCPLDNSSVYTICSNATGTAITGDNMAGPIWIHCPNDTKHGGDLYNDTNKTTDWNKEMVAAPQEIIP